MLFYLFCETFVSSLRYVRSCIVAEWDIFRIWMSEEFSIASGQPAGDETGINIQTNSLSVPVVDQIGVVQ